MPSVKSIQIIEHGTDNEHPIWNSKGASAKCLCGKVFTVNGDTTSTMRLAFYKLESHVEAEHKKEMEKRKRNTCLLSNPVQPPTP